MGWTNDARDALLAGMSVVKEASPTQLLIGNNLGKINGWVARSDVLGRARR